MRSVSTEQAGVADITITYDPSLSFAENMQRMLSKTKKTDAVDSALMYGGGIVQPTDLNNELLRIIEGRQRCQFQSLLQIGTSTVVQV